VLYTDLNHVSVVTPEWSEVMDSYIDTPDTAVKNRRKSHEITDTVQWLVDKS